MHRVGMIEVKRSRGKLTVIGMGKTPRGQKFIAATEQLEAASPADKNFKGELEKAVNKMLPSAASSQE